MTVQDMAARFEAYDKETLTFIMHEWCDLPIARRDARQAEIDARHGYKHGWIISGEVSFSRYEAFPNCAFANVWD